MHRFWQRYIGPIVELVQPRQMLEIGAEFGWNTRHILAYCRAHGAKADIVDPAPGPGFMETIEPYLGKECTYRPLKGLDAIPQIEPPDVALVDGDHNWFTVYNELTQIFARASDRKHTPPVVFLHDAGWPYARRDMYYAPETIELKERHPFAYRGIIPGQSDLTEKGLNGHFANALHEGGPRNGVMTAIEDFVNSRSTKLHLYKLPFFNGLSILVPEERLTPALKQLIESYFSAENLMQALTTLEEYSMMVRVDIAQTQIQLKRRTDALARAREIIADQKQEIDTLRAALHSQRARTEA